MIYTEITQNHAISEKNMTAILICKIQINHVKITLVI